MNRLSYLAAEWQHKPANVHAVTTLKMGGESAGSYQQFNLASHVGDDEAAVVANRAKLAAELKLPSAPVWLDQVHSNEVIHADSVQSQAPIAADASVSASKNVVCAVLTADCLPVFFCNQNGSKVAVAHAGWRGLHAGILSNTLAAMKTDPGDILVSLGPAIGPQSFEVGEEVFHSFTDKNEINKAAFVATKEAHYLCDIYQLARLELQSLGVKSIAGGGLCTYRDNQRFYSYRKQPKTGRMASLIWFS